MEAVIKTRKGAVRVDVNNPDPTIFESNSPVYQAVSAYYDRHVKFLKHNAWINGEPGTKPVEINIMPKEQAVNEGIWQILDFLDDFCWPLMTTKQFWMVPFDQLWENYDEE